MIIKEINIDERNLNYFIGINQVSLNYNRLLEINKISNDKEALDYIFNLIIKIQETYNDCTLQFIDDTLILNENHIFSVIYFVQKAFQEQINISNKKNMELLLYLAAKRQIKKGIESFGIKLDSLKEGNLTLILISPKNNLNEINTEILMLLGTPHEELTLNKPTFEKFTKIKDHFEITRNQIDSVRISYGCSQTDDVKENLDSFFFALHDLLCEKMSILSLEKIKTD